jgi:2-oxo-3-hexenedioate decarboxylase
MAMSTMHQPGQPAERDAIDPAALAASLVHAWETKTLVAAPSRLSASFGLADALSTGEHVRTLRIAAGAMPVGYKVGFTNGAVRDQFGAAGPMAAPIYDQTLQATLRINARELLGPRIEPEVVVGIGGDGAIAWAALGFEIVQSHVADWNFGYLDAIADFGLHAAMLIGERRAIGAVAVADLLALTVELRRNGEVVERGAGADVDGGVLGSLDWLRTDLRRVGRDLVPGDIITTGSMTRVPPIAPGETWTISAVGDALPALSIAVD